jgi:hypothetical protein
MFVGHYGPGFAAKRRRDCKGLVPRTGFRFPLLFTAVPRSTCPPRGLGRNAAGDRNGFLVG